MSKIWRSGLRQLERKGEKVADTTVARVKPRIKKKNDLGQRSKGQHMKQEDDDHHNQTRIQSQLNKKMTNTSTKKNDTSDN